MNFLLSISVILIISFSAADARAQGKLSLKFFPYIWVWDTYAHAYTIGAEAAINARYSVEANIFSFKGESDTGENYGKALHAGLVRYFRDNTNRSNFYLNGFLRYQTEHYGNWSMGGPWSFSDEDIDRYGIGFGVGRKQKILGRFFIDINLAALPHYEHREYYYYEEQWVSWDNSSIEGVKIVEETTERWKIYPFGRLHFIILLLK